MSVSEAAKVGYTYVEPVAPPGTAQQLAALRELVAAEREETRTLLRMNDAEAMMCRAQDRDDPKERNYIAMHTEACDKHRVAFDHAEAARAALSALDAKGEGR